MAKLAQVRLVQPDKDFVVDCKNLSSSFICLYFLFMCGDYLPLFIDSTVCGSSSPKKGSQNKAVECCSRRDQSGVRIGSKHTCLASGYSDCALLLDDACLNTVANLVTAV